jgi:hypothetical protein
MKKYNNTKTIIAVSNKPAILVYIIATLIVNIASIATTITVYAQNTTMIQQTNYGNTTTISPIKRLNSSIIIDAINTKIRSVYGEESSIISNIRH